MPFLVLRRQLGGSFLSKYFHTFLTHNGRFTVNMAVMSWERDLINGRPPESLEEAEDANQEYVL